MVAFQPPVYGRKARMTAVFSGGTIVANQGLLKAFYKHYSSGLDFVKVLINILVVGSFHNGTINLCISLCLILFENPIFQWKS